MITHKTFFEKVWYKEGELDWGGGWGKVESEMNDWIESNPDISIINIQTHTRSIAGSSIAQQRRSGGGVGYRVIYEENEE